MAISSASSSGLLPTRNISAGYTLNAQSGTTFTPTMSDSTAVVTLDNASAIAVSIPTNATTPFPIGTQLVFIQTNTGQVTISAASSGTTTIASTAGTSASPKLRTQYSSATAL